MVTPAAANRLIGQFRQLAILVVLASAATLLRGWWGSLWATSLTFTGVLIVTICLHIGSRWVRNVEDVMDAVGRHRYSLAIVAVTAFAVPAVMSAISGLPQPQISDEFSYLLAGDTFAHGRLTNPTHPMWVHFETYHDILTPTYASKFPPGQGLILALGQVVWSPVLGVWLSTAIAVAAVFWMLKQWIPPRWALLGALLVLLNPVIVMFSYAFLPGQLAVAGGAMLLGALRKAFDKPLPSTGLVAGVGLALLANTRPYEGLILTIASASVYLVATIRGKLPGSLRQLKPSLLPLSIVLLAAGLAIGYYNFRVTNSALKLPYMVYEAAYDTAPPFLWQKLPPVPTYRHKELREMFTTEGMVFWNEQHTLSGYLLGLWDKLVKFYVWQFTPCLFPIALVAPLLLVNRDRWMLAAMAILILFLAGVVTAENWFNPHYAAPAHGLTLLVALMATRRWRGWRRRTNHLGLLASRVVVVLSLGACLTSAVASVRQRSYAHSHPSWQSAREELKKALGRGGGKHLVIVRYGPAYSYQEDLVYNDADIDKSIVVWARDMGDERNEELIDYFKDRHVWMVDAGPGSLSVHPYAPDLPGMGFK